MAEAAALKYRAFLSYSHADTTGAKRLHRLLESYRIDRELVGRQTAMGTIPRALRPIFRDREDFTAGHTLTEQTLAALSQSASLIVLCSPTAAKSFNVNEEVRLFKWRYPGRPVTPVISKVNTKNPEADCFPPALRYEVTGDGEVTDRPVNALAADLREAGDGEALVLAKIVARLLGLSTDDVFRRQQRERARSQRRWIAGLSTVALGLAGLAAWAEINRREAVHQREVAERNFAAAKQGADSLIFDIAQSLRNQEGMKTETVRKILGASEKVIADLVRNSANNPELLRSQAGMLLEFSDTYASQGDTTKQAEELEKGGAILDGLVKANPADAGFQSDLAIARSKLGDVRLARGQLGEALDIYRRSAAAFEKLAAAAPNDGEQQRLLASVQHRMAIILDQSGKRGEALTLLRQSQAILERLSPAASGDAMLQRDLAVAAQKIGELLAADGRLPEALEHYRKALAIVEQVSAADPGNARWQHDMAILHSGIGEVLAKQKSLPEAHKSFETSVAILQRLAAEDPSNADRQLDLANARKRLADDALDAGQLDAAMGLYRQSLQAISPLAARDPANARFQRVILYANRQIGQIETTQNNRADAAKNLDASLALARQLMEADPNGMQTLFDLSTVLDKIADLALVDGRLADALKSREESVALNEKLAAAEPGQENHRAALAVGYGGIGVLLVQLNRKDEATPMFAKASAAAALLVERWPGVPKYQALLVQYQQMLGLLQAPAGGN